MGLRPTKGDENGCDWGRPFGLPDFQRSGWRLEANGVFNRSGLKPAYPDVPEPGLVPVILQRDRAIAPGLSSEEIVHRRPRLPASRPDPVQHFL